MGFSRRENVIGNAATANPWNFHTGKTELPETVILTTAVCMFRH